MVKRQPTHASAIRRIALFRALAPATIARLAAGTTTIALPRGKYLYRRGEHCAGLYLVTSGRIMLSVGTADANKVVALTGPGECIGLAAAVLGIPEIRTAEAVADSTLIMIPREILVGCATDNAALGLQLATTLSRDVYASTAEIEAFALHSGRQRVVDYLLQIAAANGGRQRPLTLPAKKSVIASRLSLTPEYFSRMLHDLIEAGAIAVNGRQISILDSARLRECR
jgi:CRP-like cAMP-binding protein